MWARSLAAGALGFGALLALLALAVFTVSAYVSIRRSHERTIAAMTSVDRDTIPI
jgi:hypothetical protein